MLIRAQFGTHNATEYRQDGLDRVDYRSWPYQFCSQWGFYQTGSGVPADQLPLMSRLVTLDYSTIICRDTCKFLRLRTYEPIVGYR